MVFKLNKTSTNTLVEDKRLTGGFYKWGDSNTETENYTDTKTDTDIITKTDTDTYADTNTLTLIPNQIKWFY